MSDQFPSNTRPDRVVKPESERKPEKKMERVVEGEVVRRKKPLGKRFKELFTPQDARGVFEHVILDELVPGLKDIIVNAGQLALERMFFPDIRSSSRRGAPRGSRSGSHFAYDRVSSSSRSRYAEEPRRSMSRRNRASHNFDEIIIPDRFEAQETLDNMYHKLERYEVVTVADLYDLVGITGSYTDDKWGWYDLRGAGISRTHAGYLIDLPRPEPLN